MARKRVAPHYEVIRVIILDDSPCYGGPAPCRVHGGLCEEEAVLDQLVSAHPGAGRVRDAALPAVRALGLGLFDEVGDDLAGCRAHNPR